MSGHPKLQKNVRINYIDINFISERLDLPLTFGKESSRNTGRYLCPLKCPRVDRVHRFRISPSTTVED